MKIHAQHVKQAHLARDIGKLLAMFQTALEIEHATVPPYLTALYSIKPGYNAKAAAVLQGVVIEEMLHVTICANIINALGGQPSLTHIGFIPEYPSEFPMGIADHIRVGLEAYSPELSHNVFMRIEAPDKPITSEDDLHQRVNELEHHTIGLIYRLLQHNLSRLGVKELPGNPEKQVSGFGFNADELFPVLTVEDAIRAIDVIVDQGEGSSGSPMDARKDPAHFYRFAELYHGREIVDDATAEAGYSYTGGEIPFDPQGIYPLLPNTRWQDLEGDTETLNKAREFATLYQSLIRELEVAFSGKPQHMSNIISMMIGLKNAAIQLVSSPLQHNPGKHAGPIFVN